jgi:hypothetical protein
VDNVRQVFDTALRPAKITAEKIGSRTQRAARA